jgi:hypothetical protein
MQKPHERDPLSCRQRVQVRVQIRSRIHERTISLRVFSIVLRVLRLEVSIWISKTIEEGVWFSIRFSSFLLYRNCKRLREFEVKEISRRKTLKTFVWISSKNSASVHARPIFLWEELKDLIPCCCWRTHINQ